MLEHGLLDEVKSYLAMGYSRENSAIKALGYRELIDAVEGRSTLADALESMKKKSRNYAKRQETWFRSMSNVEWIDCEGTTPAEVAGSILTHWEKLRT
jgi:tRNA dimethylallyltransferase